MQLELARELARARARHRAIPLARPGLDQLLEVGDLGAPSGTG
jgi:hypothetical protein